jgi:hypothetical protein
MYVLVMSLAMRLDTISQARKSDDWQHPPQKPLELLPKLFGPIRERYAERPGGYTRVLRVEPAKEDQAESAILELVDGPKDMRFALTAQTVARDRMLGTPHTEITKLNMEKVGKYRGSEAFEEQVSRFVEMERNGQKGTTDPEMKEKVYSKGLRDNRSVVLLVRILLQANEQQVLLEVTRCWARRVDEEIYEHIAYVWRLGKHHGSAYVQQNDPGSRVLCKDREGRQYVQAPERVERIYLLWLNLTTHGEYSLWRIRTGADTRRPRSWREAANGLLKLVNYRVMTTSGLNGPLKIRPASASAAEIAATSKEEEEKTVQPTGYTNKYLLPYSIFTQISCKLYPGRKD